VIQSPAATNIALYTGGDPTSSNINTLFTAIQAASYTTAVLWAAHIDPAGNVTMNDDLVATNGGVVAAAQPWVQLVNNLRSGTVNYVELSIGGDSSSFHNIKNLIEQYGTGPANPFYGNLQALQSALNLDAVDYDDESEYDMNSSLALASMCAGLGMGVSICPYDTAYQTYWVNLVTKINAANPGAAVAAYLQCYSGGSGNDPKQWDQAFAKTGLKMTAGLWVSSSTPAQVQSQLAAWVSNSTPLAGGFMFVGTQMLNAGGPTPADYSTAISDGLGGSTGQRRGHRAKA